MKNIQEWHLTKADKGILYFKKMKMYRSAAADVMHHRLLRKLYTSILSHFQLIWGQKENGLYLINNDNEKCWFNVRCL